MHAAALLPAAALVTGTALGVHAGAPPGMRWVPLAVSVLAAGLWGCQWPRWTMAAVLAGFSSAGLSLGAAAAADALHPPLRTALDAAFGGFSIDEVSAVGSHGPVRTRLRLDEDAAVRDSEVTLRGSVEEVSIRGERIPVQGGVAVTVAGASAGVRSSDWRAGRVLVAPMTFRRPARYLNRGVADGERASALGGVSLVGRVKSGLLVDVVERGGWFAERTARARAAVRARVGRHMAGGAASGPAIVTALLIGDRTAIAPEVRARLQAAGTYHVIAISGGNIAVLVVLVVAAARGCGMSGRLASGAAVPALVVYAAGISAGPSVWRAVATAVAYLTARAVDLRTPPWNAMAVSAAVLACAAPLEVVGAGFWLTYGATAALLLAVARRDDEAREGVRRRGPDWLLRWVLDTVRASLAVELLIAPVAIAAFSRVTVAGVVLNLLAVPAMTVAQLAGMGMVAVGGWHEPGRALGAVAGVCTDLLVGTASLVDRFPWMAPRVPPPSPGMVVTGAVALVLAWRGWPRWGAAVAAAAVLVWVVAPAPGPLARQPRTLTLTAFDVGQGEALLLGLPAGGSVLVDAGGGGASGDYIGERVLMPALWARGIRRLDSLAATHGDPDHVGGAPVLVREFRPARVWTGIPVRGHRESAALVQAARQAGAVPLELTAGAVLDVGGARIRVLHPAAPDWERPRVRNDDSLVLEVRYGDVALLLTGDIGADVERAVVPLLPPARVRVLKVAHHGSRTSTSQALADAWRPHVAVISCGRGNAFGHPAPDVLARLHDAGAAVLRTDQEGEVRVETDGRTVTYRTWRHPVPVLVHSGRETRAAPTPSN